ncbi:MAG: phosphatase PAP2 family protein [Ferruginibacter sp.]
MKRLIEFDKWLFVKLNRDGANELFDYLMPFFRQTFIWFPLYLFMALFIIINFPKKAFTWLLCIIVAVSSTDMISSRLIKPWIGRLRPCNDPDIAANLHFLAAYCGQNGSFTSSHAANHFAMATFFFFTLLPLFGRWCYLFFLWAVLVCYSQVYVGVHYPLDILGGAFLGIAAGGLAARFFIKKVGPLQIH